MIKAYTSDIKREITTTPVVDVIGQTILAKVYYDGEYKGIANTVKPDPETASAIVEVTNGGAGNEQVDYVVESKYRYEDTYTNVKTGSLIVGVGISEETITFDQEDKEDVRIRITDIGANCAINSISLQQSQFTELEGLVVGGAAGTAISIPCDFREFFPGDEYSIVFEASGYGVIGKERLVLFDKDGYSVEAES